VHGRLTSPALTLVAKGARVVSTDYVVSGQDAFDVPETLLVPASAYQRLQRLGALVEFSNDGIIGNTIEGIITSWNRGAERIFGYTAQEMLGQPIFLLLRMGGDNDMVSVFDRVRKGEYIDHYETSRRCKDGSEIPVSWTVSPIQDPSGEIVGASEIARNIAGQKQGEKAQRVAEKLAAAGRLASSIAHDINNPLAALTNLLFLVESENLSEEGKQYLKTAQCQISRLAQITTQALGFYRNYGDPVWLPISTIIDDALALHHDRIKASGIEVLRSYDSAPQVCSQPGELQQVMVNLIGNALDAMPHGGRLQLRIRRTNNWGTNRQGVRITVADTGGGMSAETRHHLFEPFYTTKQETGTGLGLWVCADIVSRYEGRILMRSNDAPGNNGSVFMLFLPL
jgi:PAS domain S-box-containing protein